ncbi:MAG: DegT/DnrJ/EryC1/StrS family aminotransferase [Candidatus Saganbacteria bacterium]|nr:DegT/DnrJ/EryC1/StrS family aminotransferase [Candidatus Saganbacteria bacterium]
MIPVSRPSIGEEELRAVKEIFDSGWLGMGSKVKEFEDKVLEYLGAKGRGIVAVNTGTSALHLAVDSLGITKGDEVIVPSLTFVASLQAISATGAVPVFCDIEAGTLNINIDDAASKITKNTKAVMAVHYRGEAFDMDRLLEITKKNGLSLIEDAAHAFGSSYKGKKIGSIGDITCFSFDPIKNITCGEGGAVLASDAKLIELMQQKRILGIDKDTWSRYRNERNWFYDVVTQGYRYHMSNINAAIGMEQLKKIDKFIKRKKEIASRYDKELSGVKGLEIIKTNYKETALFTYIIKVKKNRDELMDHLKKDGIGSGIHYIPSHHFTYYKKYRSDLPATDEVYKQILTLPLYYDMKDEDVSEVISSVRSFF